jgi:DNA-binding Lrp family transcriptional regulator
LIAEPKFDAADRALLACLQNDAASRIDDLADVAGLSVASVQRRIKRLKAEGIIEREVAVLNQTAVGHAMTFIVAVELERERLDQLHAFQRAVKAEPQIQQCYYVTGEADFVLICVAPDMDSFQALTHRLFFENQNVRKFRTSVVMGRTKVSLAVPV